MNAHLETQDLEILWSRYAESLRIRNFSEETIGSCACHFKIFMRFAKERGTIETYTITENLLTEYHRHLFYLPTRKGRPRMASTINRSLVMLKGFFRFLKQEGYIARDPAEVLEYGRLPRPLPRNILSPREAAKVIETCDTSTLTGYRDRTILEVFYATGIRKMELMNLKLEDVRLEEELLFIRYGKGAKDRVVPLGKMACQFLENYIKGIRPELLRGNESDQLFISQMGRPISATALRLLMIKYTQRSHVPKNITCHLWRHTCATHLVQNRANLRHVQEMLGHRNLSTTERYLSLTIHDLKKAHQKCHPRERDRRAQAS